MKYEIVIYYYYYYIAMEGVKNLTTAMWKKEAYTPKY